MIVRARAPLRFGLAGGGTDVSPYCDVYGGYVLNAAIARYVYAGIRTLDESKVRFTIIGQDTEDLDPAARGEFPLTGRMDLHRAVYNEMVRSWNGGNLLHIELSTYCDAPPGSGLGSSSTLVVAMVRAFTEFLNLPLDDYGIASLAFKIERIDCGLQGGRQDQYSAAFGGVNFMEFYNNGRAIVNPLRVKDWVISELEASMLLFYTGISRESASIISDQSSNVRSGLSDTIKAMDAMKQEALVMKECLLKGDFAGMVECMKSGWENKKRSARSVSNPRIEEIYKGALRSGALAGKLTGAGGGGFMALFVPPEKRAEVTKTIEGFGGVVSNFHFTKSGAQAWKVM